MENNKKFIKSKNLKISEDMHGKLSEIKSQFRFSTFEQLFAYLLDEKKSDIKEYISIKSKEDALIKLEDNIYNRVESIQKRLSKYASLYFEKIFDVYNLQEEATKEILKAVRKPIVQSEKTADSVNNDNVVLERLKSENRNLLNDSLEDEKIITDLENRLKVIKSKFELKSSAFSKVWEARINKDDFEKLFS